MLASRVYADELMDTEQVPYEDFRACLVDLAKVNQLSLAHRPTLAFFERLATTPRRLEVLDVGSGYGDMLRAVEAWGRRRGVDLGLTGVDMNPWSQKAASETPSSINWVTANAFEYAPPRPVDVVISSLFTHHLSDEGIIAFLAWMEKTAQRGWFINDLHRHPVPYHFFRGFSKLAGYHRFVQHDGPLSIARSFTREDWNRYLVAAGIDPAVVDIRWQMPFRVTVERIR